MALERLTDKTAGTVLELTDLFHGVDVSDTTSHPQGTSKKYTIQQIIDLAGGGVDPFITLVDATTVNWNLNSGKTAVVTLGGNRTLAITNQTNGMFGLLKVIQSGGSNTLILPANSKTVDGGGGALALSSGAGDIDILTFVYDGTNFLWNIGRDYS